MSVPQGDTSNAKHSARKSPGKTIFVTVGSTSFDQLTIAMLEYHVLYSLYSLGYSTLVIQHGDFRKPMPDRPKQNPGWPEIPSIRQFKYSPSLSKEIEKADLVISHAGAGTVLEVLRARKKMIVVPNETLMDNHQLELSSKLVEEGYCLSASANARSLMDAIKRVWDFQQIELPKGDGTALDRVITEELEKMDWHDTDSSD